MSVRVAVRFRPPLAPQQASPQIINEENLQLFPSLGCVNVAKHFNLYFHHVLPLYSSQDDVFSIIQPLVDEFLQGNNTCCITYGPAGCGKTYTMYGPGGEQTSPQNVFRLGLMPRVISYIFDQLQQHFNPMNGQFAYQLKCSFAEIYNKHIVDLLAHHSTTSHAKHPHKKPSTIKFKQKDNGSYYYQNLTKVTINSIADVLRYMYEAFHNRQFVVYYDEYGNLMRKHSDNTNNNANQGWTSSRSHCVSTLRLMFKKKMTNELFRVSMVFMDCGAYCKMIDSDSNSASDHDCINRSFLALGNTITGIHRQDMHKELAWKDNILTQALYPVCTDTKARVLLFLNCTARSELYEESLATLRFGNLAMTDPLLLSVMDNYRQKIKQLHIALQKHRGDGKRRRSSSSRRRSSGGKTSRSAKSKNSGSHSQKSERTNSPNSDEYKDSDGAGFSSVEVIKNENSKLKQELRELKKAFKISNKHSNELRIEKHRINKEKNEALANLDMFASQAAAAELRKMEVSDQLQTSLYNEQLLRDENAEQKRQLFMFQSENQSRLKFLNNSSVMERASVFQSKSNEAKVMINELSKQIEEMEISRADLKVQLNGQNKKMKLVAQNNAELKKKNSELQSNIAHLQSNTVSKVESQQDMQSLMTEIRNRDIRIAEFEKDAQENIGMSNHFREQTEVYEQTIHHLGNELGRYKKLFNQQKELMLRNQVKQQASGNSSDTDSTASIMQMLHPKGSESANANKNQQQFDKKLGEMKEKYEVMIYHKDEAIRKLRLDLTRAKTQSFKDEVLEKLKKRNNTLEERIIRARSEKAKMIPQLVKEKNRLKNINADMKRNIVLYVAMMIFKEKKMKKQLADAQSDVERYQRKLDLQIKGRGQLRKQMESLDSYVQNTITSAVHRRLISTVDGSDVDDVKTDVVLSTNQHFARVQQTISDLTNKLQSKHDRIMKLEEKIASYELEKTFSLTGNQSPTSHPNLWTSESSGNVADITDMQSNNSNTSNTDNNFSSEENYLKSFLKYGKKPDIFQPKPSNSLSLGFMVDNKRNVRISLDVNASFWDILHMLQVRPPKKLEDLQLKITANASPLKNEIIIPHECMHKSFWDLIIEFGILQFLSLSVITNATQVELASIAIQPKASGGLFRRLKSIRK